MGEKCGVAIIGYGGMGSWHAKQLKDIDEVLFCGIFDIADNRNEAAKSKGIHVYESLGNLLDDSNVDVVTIAIPNDQHLPVALEVMKAHKNVICEKPAALNLDGLNQMIRVSKEQDVLFTVHQNRRWDEDFLIVKQLYLEGTLGNIFNIECRVQGSRGIPGDWRSKKVHGGGMILDWGVHIFDQLLQLIPSNVKRVYAELSQIAGEDVEDGFKALIHFENGVKCQVDVGTRNFLTLPHWYVQGTLGTAIIKDWSLNGKICMVNNWKKTDVVPIVTAAGLTKTMAPRTNETVMEKPLPRVNSNIHDYYKNVAKTLKGKAQIIVKHDELRRVMRLMEVVLLSGQSGKVVNEII